MNAILFWCFRVNNATDSRLRREHFYTMKDFILRKCGVSDGYDYQLIEKVCWDCFGEDPECWSCDGTGIYAKYYVQLQRWILNDGVFHMPTGKRIDYRDRDRFPFLKNRQIIDGLVVHKPSKICIVAVAYYLLLQYVFALNGTPIHKRVKGSLNYFRYLFLWLTEDIRSTIRWSLIQTDRRIARDLSINNYESLPF